MILRVLSVIVIALIAIAIGLFVRRLLVRRLKNTVLDNWLVQTIGIIVALSPVILAAVATPFILDSTNNLLGQLGDAFKKQIQAPDLASVALNLIQGLLIFVIGIGIARTLLKLSLKSQSHLDINLRTLLGRIFYIIVLTITIFWVLSVWQISIGVPVAVISALAVAFAFAIQDILKDLVAGFYILMERPFHIGDEISTANYTGKVEDVQIRATKLRITSGEQVTIPNAMVFGGVVVNNTYYGDRRAAITVTLPQEEFIKDETPARILKMLGEIDTVMVKPEPNVFISGYAGEQLILTVRFWIANRQFATVSEVMYTLRTLFPNADLTVVESGGNV